MHEWESSTTVTEAFPDTDTLVGYWLIATTVNVPGQGVIAPARKQCFEVIGRPNKGSGFYTLAHHTPRSLLGMGDDYLTVQDQAGPCTFATDLTIVNAVQRGEMLLFEHFTDLVRWVRAHAQEVPDDWC
jgi:hypothetical protein